MASAGGRAISETEFGRLLEGLLERSGAYARSLLRDREDADDAVQQAALRALSRLAHYDPERPFAGWWFAILRNACMDVCRARRPAVATDRADAIADRAGDRGARREDWEELAAALARVGPDHEEILRLRYFGELSYDQIAAALSIAPGTVMSRLHYARKALAAAMERTTP